MKYIMSLLVLVCLTSSVSASSILQASIESIYDILLALIPIVGFAALVIILQYVGIDVIGITFSIITYAITTFFTIIEHVTSKEENLISAVIIFIVVMAVLMGLL